MNSSKVIGDAAWTIHIWDSGVFRADGGRVTRQF
jgi:hypothetical protein